MPAALWYRHTRKQAPGKVEASRGRSPHSLPLPRADYDVRSRTCRTVAAYHCTPP
jgi:hypothetical protein